MTKAPEAAQSALDVLLMDATDSLPGSWWPDYDEWLAARSGELRPAPKRLGNARHKAQAKAPGTYVHAS